MSLRKTNNLSKKYWAEGAHWYLYLFTASSQGASGALREAG